MINEPQKSHKKRTPPRGVLLGSFHQPARHKYYITRYVGVQLPVAPPKLICIRIDSARARGAGLGWHFRQEIPRGFEFRKKHSRRKAAVPQANACSVLRTGADAERLQIVGVSAVPLSI